MRPVLLVTLTLLASPAWSQGVPNGLPGGVSPTEAMAVYQTLTPEQRQKLAAGALQGKTTISPAEALSWYQSMTPQQKEMAKDWAKQQAAANPGMVAQIKAMVKQWLGK